MDIFLDLDRDYATYYHLTIDHRGWAADACFGDSSWDPKWFVAARTADGAWTAEAAIPLRELIGSAEPRRSAASRTKERPPPARRPHSAAGPSGRSAFSGRCRA